MSTAAVRLRKPGNFSAAIGLSLALLGGGANAQTLSKTAGGLNYATGGVSIEQLRRLEETKEDFSLWVTTAAKRSGAHLSDVNLRIIDAKTNVVLDTTMIGPWLFINLPLGTFTVEATFKGTTQSRTTGIHPGDHHQIIFYFESPAEVSPDWTSPFKDSPYSNK